MLGSTEVCANPREKQGDILLNNKYASPKAKRMPGSAPRLSESVALPEGWMIRKPREMVVDWEGQQTVERIQLFFYRGRASTSAPMGLHQQQVPIPDGAKLLHLTRTSFLHFAWIEKSIVVDMLGMHSHLRGSQYQLG